MKPLLAQQKHLLNIRSKLLCDLIEHVPHRLGNEVRAANVFLWYAKF